MCHVLSCVNKDIMLLYVHTFFNDTPICVLWPYLSYFSCLIISIWQNLVPPPRIGRIWVPPSSKNWENLDAPSNEWRNVGVPSKASIPPPRGPPVMFSERSLIKEFHCTNTTEQITKNTF